MALGNHADVLLGGVPLRIDRDAPEEIQQPSFERRADSLFRRGLDVTGVPGAQNLREDRLVQYQTDWSGGENLKALRDPQTQASRFFRSEGLDASVPGELTLNRSTNRVTPIDGSGGATATVEADDYSDSTGTSTVVNSDDRQLEALDDVIESPSFIQTSGGTYPMQADFYLYKETVVPTSIDGDDLIKVSSPGGTSGGVFQLRGAGGECRTQNVDLLGLGASDVTWHLTYDGQFVNSTSVRISIIEQGAPDKVVATRLVTQIVGSFETLTFTPHPLRHYRFHAKCTNLFGDDPIEVNSVAHSPAVTATTVRITVRDHDGGTTVSTQDVAVNNVSSINAISVNWDATDSVNYRFRVTYLDGRQRPVLDKHITTILSTGAPYSFDCMELGQGGNVIAVGHRTGGDPEAWAYNFTDEDWDIYNAVIPGVNGATCLGLAHSDKYEYAVFSSGVVVQFNDLAQKVYTAAVTGAVGIAICQDRLFVLSEDPAVGVSITTFAVDADVSAAVTAPVATGIVTSALVASDTSLRQRMVGTPYGAYFFVNFSYDLVIYKADASGETLLYPEVARLEVGSKATAIAHNQGLTFVASQSFAETGTTPNSVLSMVDQNGTPRTLGEFRKKADDASAAPVIDMQVWQRGLWLLQGRYVWRWSMSSGGLFCEYELDPTDETYARAISVVQGHTFAMFSQESSTQTGGTVWVTGSEGTYRQSTVTGGNSVTGSIYDSGLPDEQKLLRRIIISTDDMPTNTTVTSEVQLDQDGTWVEMGTHTAGTQAVLTKTDPVIYRSIQTRTTLGTSDGVDTPTLKSVLVDSLPLAQEQFFNLIILTETEDSGDHIGAQTKRGGEIAEAIWGMQSAGTPVTFVDGYSQTELDENPSYLVRVEDSRQTNDDISEGRMSVKLRVLDG